tara:strand:+ start:418 stop:624 length:207 start_codon:yes stop_codon:yes gene_type:complete
MDIIVLNDGIYSLIPITKQMMGHISLVGELDLFDLCDILRLELTEYDDAINRHVMKDGSGDFFGCIMR